MSTEELQKLQEERAKEFGVEALPAPPARLNIPKNWPRKFADYGDPVNLGYPLAPEARLKSARARFKSTADRYKEEASKRVVHNRIAQRMLREGMKVKFDAEDPLDALLSPAIKRRLTKKSFDGLHVGEVRVLSAAAIEAKKYEPVDGEIIVESFAAASNIDLTMYVKGPADRLEKTALQEIADWLVARYKTILFNHIDDRPIGRVLEAEVVTDDADGITKLRIVHTVSGSEPDIIAKIKDGTLSKLSIRFIPTEVKLEIDPETKRQVRVIVRAVGLEASIVSVPMNWAADVIDWQARSAADALGDAPRVGVELAAAVEWDAKGEAFTARIDLADIGESIGAALAKRLLGAPFSREDSETGGFVTGVRRGAGELVIDGVLAGGGAPGDLRSLTLYGHGVADEAGALVGFGADAIELSFGVPDATKSYPYQEQTMDEEKAAKAAGIAAACAQIGALVKSFGEEADAERKDELAGEVDVAFRSLDLGIGDSPVIHPLSKGAGMAAYIERLAVAKSAGDCHMALFWQAIDMLDWLATSQYSELADPRKAELAGAVATIRKIAGGDQELEKEPAPAATSAGDTGEAKSLTSADLDIAIKSATEALATVHAAELKSLRDEADAKAAAAAAEVAEIKSAIAEGAKRADELGSSVGAAEKAATDALAAHAKAAEEKAATMQSAIDSLTSHIERIQKHVGRPNGRDDGGPPAQRTSAVPNADIGGDLVSLYAQRA